MASSYSSPNFDGPMRADANHAGNPSINPNSDQMHSKFRPDTAEAPYAVSDNIVSRKSHYWHEGKLSEYDQPRELYRRVMNDERRAHLHENTANWLQKVSKDIIKIKYLAQQYLIAPEYAQGIYDLLPSPAFTMAQVKETSVGAEKMGKHEKFLPTGNARSVGYPAPQGMGYAT
jgi:catalase